MNLADMLLHDYDFLNRYNGSIRIGIKAPDHIKILRNELLNRQPKHSPPKNQLIHSQYGE